MSYNCTLVAVIGLRSGDRCVNFDQDTSHRLVCSRLISDCLIVSLSNVQLYWIARLGTSGALRVERWRLSQIVAA